MPTCGSIVQKGKFSAGAFDFVRALKSVDLPTFGSPTIPHCKDIKMNPEKGLSQNHILGYQKSLLGDFLLYILSYHQLAF